METTFQRLGELWIGLTPAILACALMAAIGMLMVSSAIADVPNIKPIVWRIQAVFGRKVSLDEVASRLTGDDSLVIAQSQSLFDRAVAPLVRGMLNRANGAELRWLKESLDKLGKTDFFKNVSDYYAAKVFLALVGFVTGLVTALSLVVGGAPALIILALPLAFALMGYHTPRYIIADMLRARREQIIFEAPYVLNRLMVFLALDGNVINAIAALAGVTERAGAADGGYLVREFRQIHEDYLYWHSLERALTDVISRNNDVPILQRIGERLLMSYRDGAAAAHALGVIADRAQVSVENLIQKRGNQNSTVMIVPTIVALMGILGAIAGPALYSLTNFF